MDARASIIGQHSFFEKNLSANIGVREISYSQLDLLSVIIIVMSSIGDFWRLM